MKKLRLFGMFALTFALVFGAASCKQDAGPSGDNVADVLKDGEDLSGTWKITDGSVYLYSKTNGAEVKYEYDSIAEIVDYMDFEDTSFTLTKDEAKEFFGEAAADIEHYNEIAEKFDEYKAEMQKIYGSDATIEGDADARLVINGARTKITYYLSTTSYVKGTVAGVSYEANSEQEIEIVFEKQ
ncbi:MAG: hypothetical protein J6J00_01750 [Treponema sp.]|nr:hypothetical protein [Treponema sp.]